MPNFKKIEKADKWKKNDENQLKFTGLYVPSSLSHAYFRLNSKLCVLRLWGGGGGDHHDSVFSNWRSRIENLLFINQNNEDKW